MLMNKKEFESIKKFYQDSYNIYNLYNENLYHCKATIFYDVGVAILKSYNTIVAIYCFEDNNIYINGFYSHTTACHIHKFKKYFNADTIINFNTNKYYKRGRWVNIE